MRILFIGTVISSKTFLNKLISINENVVGVITKKESKTNSDYADLTGLCDQYKISYLFVDNINEEISIEYIRSMHPDIIYCFGWSELIKKEILIIPPKGVIGYHPAKLPYNKGRHPIIWALALGLKETASTFFVLEEGADTGDILAQENVTIEYEDDANTLYNKLLEVGCSQLELLTEQLRNNCEVRINQSNKLGNNWRKRKAADGKIDWRMASYSIYNLVRALARPYVGAHFAFMDMNIKVWSVQEVMNFGYENIESGKVIEVYSKNSFLVKAGDNLIKVLSCDDIELEEGDYL